MITGSVRFNVRFPKFYPILLLFPNFASVVLLFVLFCEFCVGDQLAIAKETGRRLGMGSNMYPSASLLGQDKDSNIAALPVEELIEKADGFAGVFPGASSVHPPFKSII